MDRESPGAGPASGSTAPPPDPSPPVVADYMDRWSRNLRLYETLKGMGLFVSPIPETHDPTKIRYMIVSADLPMPEGSGDEAGDGRGKSRDGRSAAASDNVIDFPTAG